MKDIWLPRLYILGEIALLIVTGTLIALGHNSTITDLFCVAGGGLTAHSFITKAGRTPTPSD
jgi:hypothetical protein